MKSKRIIITGLTGQDGSYMAEYCLNLGHKVFGVVRRTSQIHDKNFRHISEHPNFTRVYGDLLDSHSINGVVKDVNPDYFINFAAQSFVGVSWKIPEETFMVGAVGVLKCLEAIRNYAPQCRFYNAGSSEQFGDVIYSPQDEKHPFRPRSPYGAAKCAADHLVKVYRESYGLYAVQGLLFNHESERRGEEFVTRKITKGIARIKKALLSDKPVFEPIRLGNLDAKRDWSHAEDFVDGVWRMLNQEQYNDELLKKLSGHPVYLTREPRQGAERHLSILNDVQHLSKHVKGYVLASGETHTIREFVELAFKHANVRGKWGTPLGRYQKTDEVLFYTGHDRYDSTLHANLVEISPDFYRPAEVELLLGDSTLARKELGWEPKISLDILAKRMVESDLHEAGIRLQDEKTT